MFKKNRTYNSIVIIFLISLSVFTIEQPICLSQPPTVVQGYVYIDDVLTVTNEVKLIFSDRIKTTIPFSNGRYVFIFSDDQPGDYATFKVEYNENIYYPSENFTRVSDEYLYNINLYIQTKNDGDQIPDGNETSDDDNLQPSADAGGPYYSLTNSTITFDASASIDPDGVINIYEWDLGDGSFKTGKIVIHNYTEEGEYEVILTVTDDGGATAVDITFVYISIDSNNPPTQPTVIGNSSGFVNILYEFTANSIDLENNTIKYVFDWGDQTETISEFLVNSTNFNTSHQWTIPGIYILKVYAEDNLSAMSKITKINVLINTHFCDKYGFLIDYTDDEIYDVFHSNFTGNETFAKFANGNYLINDDDDEDWDFQYNIETDSVFNFGDAGFEKEEKVLTDSTIFVIIGIIVIIIFTIVSLVMIIKNKKVSSKNEKVSKKEEEKLVNKKHKEKTKDEVKKDISDIEKEVDEILKGKNNI